MLLSLCLRCRRSWESVSTVYHDGMLRCTCRFAKVKSSDVFDSFHHDKVPKACNLGSEIVHV